VLDPWRDDIAVRIEHVGHGGPPAVDVIEFAATDRPVTGAEHRSRDDGAFGGDRGRRPGGDDAGERAGVGGCRRRRHRATRESGSRWVARRGLLSRTIEVLDQRGVAERFLEEGQTSPAHGFAGIPLDISDFPTRHNYVLARWQRDFERILAGWVDELGVPIRREREVTGFAQDDAGGRPVARSLRVGQAGRVVVEEQAGHEVAAGAAAHLVEDRLQVVLDGVCGDVEPHADVVGGEPLRDELGDPAFAVREAVRVGDQRRELRRAGVVDHHGDG
jgi:hypothetical protein